MKSNLSISSIITRSYALFLALLGFSCSDGEGECMYGTPTGSFEVKGAVTTEDGTPLPEAVIRVTTPEAPSGIWSYANTATDKEGSYIIQTDKVLTQKLKIVCISLDKDFDSDSIIMPVKFQFDNDHPKDKKDPWYIGHADLTVDFKLKAKPVEE
ncbi:MAG: hypothetical protein HDS02_06110 [Bacteroides sp.]|nr:hypothetical protein [Bacteroides sp.]